MKSPKYSKKSKSKKRMYKKGSKKRSRVRSKMYKKGSKKRSRVRSKMYKKGSKKRSRVRSRVYKKSSKKRSRVKRRSKSKVRIPIRQKGLLFGYHVDMTAKSRRSLLKRLLSKRKATYSQIIKRLNVLKIYNKNRHPEISEKIKRDIDFIHRHYQKYSMVYQRKVSRKTRSKRKSKYRYKM